MVQAFNTPAFPVDTHIHRLALRWGLTKNEKNASKCVYRCTYVAYFFLFFLCVGIVVAGGGGSRRLLRLVGSRDRIPRDACSTTRAITRKSCRHDGAAKVRDKLASRTVASMFFLFFFCVRVCVFFHVLDAACRYSFVPQASFLPFVNSVSSATHQKCEQARIYSSTPPPFFSPCPPSATTPSVCTTGWSQS